MTRTLTFAASDDVKFATFVKLFLTGGNLLHFNPQTGPSARTREDRKMEAKIVRAYKAISVETPEGRKLAIDGGVLTIDQSSFVLLEKYLAAAPASTQEADIVDDLIEWVSAADKSEG